MAVKNVNGCFIVDRWCNSENPVFTAWSLADLLLEPKEWMGIRAIWDEGGGN